MYDEDARWLRVHRGPYQLVCNFGAEPAAVPIDAPGEIVVATHDDVVVGDGAVTLPPLAGVLLR